MKALLLFRRLCHPKAYCSITEFKDSFLRILLTLPSLYVAAMPSFAQPVSITGGLRMVIRDPQSLYAQKSVQSGTNNSGGSSNTSGGATAAETNLILTSGVIMVNGVSANTRTQLSHKGFTTEGTLVLGPSTLQTSAFAIADTTVNPAVTPASVNYSAYTILSLIREARSMSPSFINIFSNSL